VRRTADYPAVRWAFITRVTDAPTGGSLVDDEFDQLDDARAKAADDVDAHIRKLWQQDVDQEWRHEYEQLSRVDDADTRFMVYMRSRAGRS
jgi:predicted secreted protein